MLCDRIVDWRSHYRQEMSDGWTALFDVAGAKITRGVRFNLSDELIPILVDLARDRPQRVLDALAFARVPHQTTWIEYPFAPLRRYYDSLGFGSDGRTNTGDPVRIGMLIEADVDRPDSFLTHIAYDQPGQPPVLAAAAIRFDGAKSIQSGHIAKYVRESWHAPASYTAQHPPSEANVEATVAYCRHFSFERAPLWSVMRQEMFQRREEDAEERIFEAGAKDAASEIGLLIATLIMMNTINGIRVADADVSQLNRSRAKSGKPPLLGYSTAHFRLSRSEQKAIGSFGGGTTKAWHICRGHFKQRKKADGSVSLIWWREHWRGDQSRLRIKPPIIRVTGPATMTHIEHG